MSQQEEEEEIMEVSEEEEEEEEEVEYEEVSEEEDPEEEEPEEEDQSPNPKQKPTVLESISNLQSLHGALSEFLSHYNSLQQTLDSISSSIDAKSKSKPIKINDKNLQQALGSISSSIDAKTNRKPIKTEDKNLQQALDPISSSIDAKSNNKPIKVEDKSLQQALDSIGSSIDAKSNDKPIKIEDKNLQQALDPVGSSIDSKSNNKPTKIKDKNNPIKSEDKQYTELEHICRTNGAKTLRKYVSTHLAEIGRLRKEIPEALKLSSDPAKLVLAAMGKFYLQGSRAYERGYRNAIDTRRAGILLLEFYVLAGCPMAEHPDDSVKDSARDAAVSWRSRLISEGGLEAASAVDALGLVLLLASFGVPSEFRAKDLYSLLRLSKLEKKRDVLRRSPSLVQKMPDIIKDLTTKDMHVEAVFLICAFDLEEKFPPLPLLSSFVKKTCEAGIEERRQGQCSLRSLMEAYEKELAALKSVLKCLEDNKLDATQLAGLEIDQKIANCEKEILNGAQKFQDKNLKRRFGDVGPLKNEDSQIKQLRPSSAEASHGPLPQPARQSQEQRIAAVSDSRYAYNGYTLNDKPFPAEASHGLVARDSTGMLPQSVHAQGGLYVNAVYQSSGEQSLLGTAYPSGHAFTRYPATAGQSFYQPPASEQHYYQPAASGQHYYQPPALGQNSYQPPASMQNSYQPPASVQNSYQPPASVQNSYQPPASGQNYYPLHVSSLGTAGRNLYLSADNVSERELPNYSTTSNGVPTASTDTNPAHQPSYTG